MSGKLGVQNHAFTKDDGTYICNGTAYVLRVLPEGDETPGMIPNCFYIEDPQEGVAGADQDDPDDIDKEPTNTGVLNFVCAMTWLLILLIGIFYFTSALPANMAATPPLFWNISASGYPPNVTDAGDFGDDLQQPPSPFMPTSARLCQPSVRSLGRTVSCNPWKDSKFCNAICTRTGWCSRGSSVWIITSGATC